MMDKQLIIEIPYGGMGDHLFHTPIPRIAKEIGGYKKVYISDYSLFRHEDNKRIIWELNPYVDGFISKHGQMCNLNQITNQFEKSKGNLLDHILFAFNLWDGEYNHEPELYYKPCFRKDFNITVYDPNYLSWVGELRKNEVMKFFEKKDYSFDSIMKIRTPRALYVPNEQEEFIETPTLEDFCDLIHSTKKLFCLTSGTATLAAALGKSATVFYGQNQSPAFRHSSLHNYVLIKRPLHKRVLSKIKSYFNLKNQINNDYDWNASI